MLLANFGLDSRKRHPDRNGNVLGTWHGWRIYAIIYLSIYYTPCKRIIDGHPGPFTSAGPARKGSLCEPFRPDPFDPRIANLEPTSPPRVRPGHRPVQ